jgi:hypothetical protein
MLQYMCSITRTALADMNQYCKTSPWNPSSSHLHLNEHSFAALTFMTSKIHISNWPVQLQWWYINLFLLLLPYSPYRKGGSIECTLCYLVNNETILACKQVKFTFCNHTYCSWKVCIQPLTWHSIESYWGFLIFKFLINIVTKFFSI